jgi:cellulose synthase/poly-beta-1,6-N-acetylglucosamine synthase-like glycosyltransferase
VSTFVGRTNNLANTLRFLVSLGSLVWLALSLQWLLGIRKIPVLEDVSETDRLDHDPALSIILAARDEGRSVGEGVKSMLAQDYSGTLEIIAVNDRSTDRTGEILEELATKHPDRLRVSNVESLPEGWLGKTHALYTGAAQAQGEWLLFTDADVVFTPHCADRATRYATTNGLDHLTMPPEIVCRSVLLRSFVAAFTLVFEITQRPWRAGDPQAQEHVGVGAFNLIRKDAYERSGTHRAIRMRPDDDMKLAKLLKRHGFRQGVAYGAGLISVEWHQTLPDAVRGLSKSMFSGLDYRIGATVAGVLMLRLPTCSRSSVSSRAIRRERSAD